WRRRWDSLRLFTTARRALPGLDLPVDPDAYPTKDQVADYLAAYYEEFGLSVSWRTRVTKLTFSGDSYALQTTNGDLTATQLVLATGPFQLPRTPPFSAQVAPSVHQLHSDDYRTPEALPDGPVLIIGDGNSGRQLAAELVQHWP